MLSICARVERAEDETGDEIGDENRQWMRHCGLCPPGTAWEAGQVQEGLKWRLVLHPWCSENANRDVETVWGRVGHQRGLPRGSGIC